MYNSFATPWTVTHQAPLSMGYSRQEYCSGLSFPYPGDLLDPGIELVSPALAGRFFTTKSLGKPSITRYLSLKRCSLIKIWWECLRFFLPFLFSSSVLLPSFSLSSYLLFCRVCSLNCCELYLSLFFLNERARNQHSLQYLRET